MKILAIETATEACSAALLVDGEVTERYLVQPRGHSELILSMVEELLAGAELPLSALDAVAFGRGPGSFTGVRIATGVIQGIAFAADLPVAPVSTLAALAQRYYRESGETRLLPAYDARMQEVYWGAYIVSETGLVKVVVPDEVSDPAKVSPPQGDGWCGVGSGWGSYGQQLRSCLNGGLKQVQPEILCSAHDVALLGEACVAANELVVAEMALPVYLRDKVAAKPGKR
ncbi:MAG: tRNA (adenosine(37)-N6)-threonylcarbamoyltransferase complex dimerization subunit type 1 TsaB [Candidatus Sedimenticola sp. (ex Thyasira tokunagai)]